MNWEFAQERHVSARAQEVNNGVRGDKMKRLVAELRGRQGPFAVQNAATDAGLKELGYGG